MINSATTIRGSEGSGLIDKIAGGGLGAGLSATVKSAYA
jgi:hypothetical protein